MFSSTSKADLIQPPVTVRRLRFAALLPLLILVVCFLDVLVPTLRTVLALRQHASAGHSVRIEFGQFVEIVPKEKFLSYAFERATYSTQRFIVALNAPACFLAALISWLTVHRPRWTPGGLMPWQWIAITFPIYALPAWWFVGWSVDIWVRRKRMPAWIGLASGLLSCGLALLAFGLWSGLTDAERGGQDLILGIIIGFPLWAFLLAIPFGGWIRSTRLKACG
jgi:hypothetical protein